MIGSHAQHWFNGEKGLVITLTDPWVLSSEVCAQLPLLAWIPVDHQPLMPRTHFWLVESQAIPVAMSRFGEEQLRNNGHSPLYVPHGYDPDVFQPLDPAERIAVRKELGIPLDAFVVGMNAANKGPRKCFPEAIMAFKQFRDKVGRQAVLYLHTNLREPEGVNIAAICDTSGIVPLSTNQYHYGGLGLSPKDVARIMGTWDVLLNPASGEGFGVPLVEAQACGVPCVVTNFSASPEVAPVEQGNWAADGQPIWTGFESYQVTPDVVELADALEEAFEEATKDRLERRQRVRSWVHSQYRADEVTDTYWKPALEDATMRMSWARSQMARARR